MSCIYTSARIFASNKAPWKVLSYPEISNLLASASREFLWPGNLFFAMARESSISHISSRHGYLEDASFNSLFKKPMLAF